MIAHYFAMHAFSLDFSRRHLISTRQNIGGFAPRRVSLRTRMFRHRFAFGEMSKLNDLFPWWTGLSRCLTAESGKLPVGLVPPSRSTKAGYLAGRRVMGCRRKRRACPYQSVRHGINGQLGGLRKALFRRKGGQARNYGFAFIGVDEGSYHSSGWGREASSLLGITTRILEHMLSALRSRKAFGESYRLLDRPENTGIALLSVRVTVFCAQITARRDDDRGRS